MKLTKMIALLSAIMILLSLATVGVGAASQKITKLTAMLEDYRIGEEVDEVGIEFRNDDIFDEDESFLLDENGKVLHYGRIKAFTKYSLRVVLIPERYVDLSGLTAKDVTLNGTAAKTLEPLGRAGGIVLTFALPTLSDHHLPFTDVRTNDWFFEDVEYVYKHQLMSGTALNTFSPKQKTTREQMVTVIWRMHGSPRAKGRLGFKDVKKNGYSAEAITWAKEQGIAAGISDTKFAPRRAVTRQELVTFFYSYANFIGENTNADANILTIFRDRNDVARYARPAMRWAVQNGIINGTTKRTISPESTATRAQIATILTAFEQNL